MPAGATVAIPWRGGCEHRTTALEWVTDRYTERHPGWRLLVAQAPPGPWSKGAALANATADLDPAEIVIVADADVWTDGLEAAAQAVRDGAGWAVPHRGVHRLTENATLQVLHGAEPHHDLEHAERAYTGLAGGGIVALAAETLRRVPMDPRFTGWGGEDQAWSLALTTIAGHPWRGKAPLWHLWHPPQERLTRKIGSVASHQLYRRYLAAARKTPAAMEDLIEEGRAACLSTTF